MRNYWLITYVNKFLKIFKKRFLMFITKSTQMFILKKNQLIINYVLYTVDQLKVFFILIYTSSLFKHLVCLSFYKYHKI